MDSAEILIAKRFSARGRCPRQNLDCRAADVHTLPLPERRWRRKNFIEPLLE